MHKQAKRLLISSASIGVTGGRQANKDMAWAVTVCVVGSWLDWEIAMTGVRHGKCFSSSAFLFLSVTHG